MSPPTNEQGAPIREAYVTWTDIGGIEVGLRTRRIEHIEDDGTRRLGDGRVQRSGRWTSSRRL